MKKLLILLVGAIVLLSVVQARLIDRGCGLIYDTTLNITWLQDANFAATSGFDKDGMSYDKAVKWAADLKYYDSCRGKWWTDWRLPDSKNWNGTGPSMGYVSTSEMGYMFFNNLGNSAGNPCITAKPTKTSYTNPDGRTVYIKNLQTAYGTPSVYWSRNAYDPLWSWTYQFSCGNQGYSNRSLGLHAWAVRNGDVGVMIFKDDFEDGNLNGWQMKRPSDWSVISIGGSHGKVARSEIPPNPYFGALNSLLPPTRNYAVEADVRVLSEGSGGLHGVVGRATDMNNAYLFGFHLNAEGVPEHWALIKRVNGAGEHVTLKYTNGTLAKDRWYKLKMSFNGDKITLYIDGKQVWSGYDSTLKGKKFGIIGMSYKDEIDNVLVTTTDTRLFHDDFADKEASDWMPDGCNSQWTVKDVSGVHGYVYDSAVQPGPCLDSLYNQAIKSKDILIEADVYVVQETTGGYHGVIGHAKDFDNYYVFDISAEESYNPNVFVLYKRVNGVNEVIATQSYPVKSNRWYRLGLKFTGNTITCYIDGKQVWKGTDPSAAINGYKIGLKAHGTPTRFDNVQVTQK